ncbi:hypothetical protein V9L05_04445 [Bernardetia sp. Wsw4-3y2]|uniref:hypothetical protein n=1 Tax=Bernardetia sp. Wsw4-3y2 TaxID=3127471 RepID=UPI0030D340AC
MKNKTIFYFISAFLWLGLAFFTYFIYQNSDEQEIETIVESSTKIDDLYQEYYYLEYAWWERNKLASFVYLNKREIEIINNLENSKQAIKTFRKSDKITFSEIEKQFPKLSEYQKENYVYPIEDLVANERVYLNSKLTNLLYKNILLRAFRIEWQIERDYKIHEGCVFFNTKPKLDEVEKRKIALFTQSIFDHYTVGYFSFPNNREHVILTESSKNFEFEMTTKILGRNPKVITKKYRTLLKEGQELRAFDYEEIE